jgi:hypothetical protein
MITSGIIITLITIITESNTAATSTNSNISESSTDSTLSIVTKSNSPSGYSDNVSLDGSAVVDRVEKIVDDESKIDEEELNRWYMEVMNLHFSDIGLLKYIEGGKVQAERIEKVQSPMDPDKFEFTYYLEGTLNDEFRTLPENDQFDLLDKISVGSYEYYWGNQFDVGYLNLFSNSDTFQISWDSLLKNGESFWLQLENPWSDISEDFRPLNEE